jgi:hypothetical protein
MSYYICTACGEDFDTPGNKCNRRQTPKYCLDRDVYRGRGECACEDCCPLCGSEAIDEIQEGETAE